MSQLGVPAAPYLPLCLVAALSGAPLRNNSCGSYYKMTARQMEGKEKLIGTRIFAPI